MSNCVTATVKTCECGAPATTQLRGVWQCRLCARMERQLYPTGWAGRELKRLGHHRERQAAWAATANELTDNCQLTTKKL